MTTDPLAQAVMVAYCGWDPTVQVTNETITLDGNGTAWAFLPSLNVTAVGPITVTNPDGSTYAPTIGPGMNDVSWSDDGILTWMSCNNGATWPEMQQAIQVTYTGGWNGAPDDLAAALAKLSARMPSITGAASIRLGSAAINYAATSITGQPTGAASIAAGGLLLVEQMVFDKYRLPKAR